MADIRIEDATREAALHVAANLRDEDRREVEAYGYGITPEEAISMSLDLADRAWIGSADGVPGVVFGIHRPSFLEPIGEPWLLGTPLLVKHAPRFLPESRRWVRAMLREFDVLRNVVHEENQFSRRWLAWLGAEFSEPFPYGGAKEPFRLFEIRG